MCRRVAGVYYLSPLEGHHLRHREPVAGILNSVIVLLVTRQRAFPLSENHHVIHLGKLGPFPICSVAFYLEPEIVQGADGVVDIHVADPKIE